MISEHTWWFNIGGLSLILIMINIETITLDMYSGFAFGILYKAILMKGWEYYKENTQGGYAYFKGVRKTSSY